MIETTEFKYFVGDKICVGTEGTKTKPDEIIALEIFDESLKRWITVGYAENGEQYRIKHETKHLEIASGFNKFSFDYSKPICQKCKRDCDNVEEQIRIEDLWEQRRYEIARDIIPAIYRMEFTTSSRDAICGYAIKYADELIKQLKGE